MGSRSNGRRPRVDWFDSISIAYAGLSGVDVRIPNEADRRLIELAPEMLRLIRNCVKSKCHIREMQAIVREIDATVEEDTNAE